MTLTGIATNHDVHSLLFSDTATFGAMRTLKATTIGTMIGAPA